MLSDYRKVLVFAAHADDELAMAPTIWKFVQAGRKVYVVNTTNGSEGYPKLEWKDKIVEMRRREAAACDKVLGVKQRFFMDYDTQGVLGMRKECLQEFMSIIRQVRPDVIFTHGPEDKHIDHITTSHLSVHAFWQAGQPVALALGKPWNTPYIFYYKGIRDEHKLPRIEIDVSDSFYKRFEALATQESQFTLFKKTRSDFLREAKKARAAGEKKMDKFWIAAENVLEEFPRKPRQAKAR